MPTNEILFGACRSRECRRALENEEEADRGYCSACWEPVWAFQPNSDIRDWYFVASELRDRSDGDEISGDQCGNCGGSGWTFHHTKRGMPVVRCSRDPIYDRDEGEEDGPSCFVGCHTDRPVHLLHTFEVIF